MSSKIDIKCVYLNENFEILDANREFYVYFDAVGSDVKTIEDLIRRDKTLSADTDILIRRLKGENA